MKQHIILCNLVIVLFTFVGCTNAAKKFDRDPEAIHYSKHARCRMECRHVDESEVKEMIEKGDINFSKSELNTDDCHKRYALEGVSHDRQRLRIIVAECNDDLTVITVIDLGQEWPCDCE
jgi:hypothetical protein